MHWIVKCCKTQLCMKGFPVPHHWQRRGTTATQPHCTGRELKVRCPSCVTLLCELLKTGKWDTVWQWWVKRKLYLIVRISCTKASTSMLTNEIPLGDNNGLWLFWVLLDDKKVLCAVYIHKTLVRCTGTFWSPCNKVARCSGQHHPGGHISSTHRPLIASHWVPLLHCLHSVSHHTLTHWCLTRHPNHYWHVSWNASIGNTLAGTSRTTATSPHSPVMQHVWMRKGSYTLWVSFRLSWSQSTSLPS